MADKTYYRNRISADILSFERGMEHFEDVNAIKLNSSKYNLLIMSDYIPMIGELIGDMTIVLSDGTEKTYAGVDGYYRLAHNEFEFLVRDKNIYD